jgi:hypothetical protein
MKQRLKSALAALLLVAVLGVGLGFAAGGVQSYKFSAVAGTTVHTVGADKIQVTTSASVTVYISIANGVVTGAVEPLLQSGATVTIVLLHDVDTAADDEVLFSGKIDYPAIFSDIYPHETGHTEE